MCNTSYIYSVYVDAKRAAAKAEYPDSPERREMEELLGEMERIAGAGIPPKKNRKM